MSRKMIPILLLVFFISAISHSFFASHMGSAQAAESMAVTSAKVTFNPKKKDTFVLKGTTGSLSLTGATSVIFEAGPFNQEIALNAFTKSKEKYTFKAAAGQAGLTNLVLDMAKGQFSAKVQKVFLSGFTNPLPVRLTAATSAGCSMIQFGVNKGKWTFSGTSNPQYGCLIGQTPQATPKGLFVNKATVVTVQVQVPSHPDLNQNSIGLFRVDSNLNILSGPLCGFSDNGSLINGDQTKGDRIFSCFANLQEGTAGKMFLVVGAELGGKMTYSPSFSLDVVTPYTEQQAQQTMTAQESAGQAWQDNLAKYGDTKKARTETVKTVKTMEGVKDAGISSDGVNIWIEFTSGIKGGLLLSQEEEKSAGPVVESIEPSVRRTADIPFYVPPTSCTQKSVTAEGTSSAESVSNCNVLIWDLYASSKEDVDISAFTSNPSMRFRLTIEYSGLTDDPGCQVDSLRDIWQNGTVLIKTEGRRGAVQPLFKTSEIVTLQKLAQEKYMLEVLTGCLVAGHNPYIGETKFYFTPSFISTLEGKFDKRSIVYVESPYSSELASAFLSKGVHTFFGYSGGGMNTWYIANENRNKLFTSMVKDGMNTGEDYAALPILSFGTSLFLKYSSSVQEIAYGNNGCYYLMWEEDDFPAGALNGQIEIQTELTRLQYTVVKPLLSMFVYVTSHVSGKAEAAWKKMKDGAKELAEQTNSILLVDDADFILLGNDSLNPGGGYAPGGWGYFFYKGNIIEVLSFRCFYGGYDTNCGDMRLKGLTLNALSALFIEEKDRAAGVIAKRCGTGGCID
jgi:hypothetical protein